jgi:hypothetical protein
MFASQGQQAMQNSRANGAALLHHGPGPTAGVFAKEGWIALFNLST